VKKYIDIMQEAIERAERIGGPLSEFAEGLEEMECLLSERRLAAQEEVKAQQKADNSIVRGGFERAAGEA
jgi:hypothetical protein